MDQYMSPNKESKLEPLELQLSDHDYWMQNPMELVETDHLLEPKEEKPDHYEYQLLEPKSEALFEYPEYLKLEPKLEETDDFGYTRSMQNSVKQEDVDDYLSEDLLEPKLKEPDDFEYPEYLKLEPIEIEHDIGPIRSENSYSKRKPCNRKCAICHKLVRPDHFICTVSKKRQMILMLGLVLAKKKSVEEAQLLIGVNKLYTCNVHSKEAIDEIFRRLNIKSLEEFVPLGNKNMQIFLEKLDIAKVICPGFSVSKFYFALIATARVFISKSSTIKALRQKRWCMVCHQLESVEGFTNIISKYSKLVLLVGLILGRKKTMKEANGLMTNATFFCCESHLSEAGYKILEVLNIQRIDEWHLCTRDKLAEVMAIVWKLCPKCSIAQFKKHFTIFLRMFPLTIGN